MVGQHKWTVDYKRLNFTLLSIRAVLCCVRLHDPHFDIKYPFFVLINVMSLIKLNRNRMPISAPPKNWSATVSWLWILALVIYFCASCKLLTDSLTWGGGHNGRAGSGWRSPWGPMAGQDLAGGTHGAQWQGRIWVDVEWEQSSFSLRSSGWMNAYLLGDSNDKPQTWYAQTLRAEMVQQDILLHFYATIYSPLLVIDCDLWPTV